MNTAPIKKLHTSPMPRVEPWKMAARMFFIRHTTMPETGPMLKAASSAGSSETSILTKLGMSMGSGKSSIMSTQPTALSMAVTTRARRRMGRVFALVSIVIPSRPAEKKPAFQKFFSKAGNSWNREMRPLQTKTPC